MPPIALPCPIQPAPKDNPHPIVLVCRSFVHVPPLSPIIRTPGHCQFVLYFHVSGSISLICFTDQVPLIGEIIWYLSFITWLTSLSIMLSSSIHAVTKGRSSFFLSACVIFHCVNVPQFFDPLIYSRVLRLFPTLGYCKYHCYEHCGA